MFKKFFKKIIRDTFLEVVKDGIKIGDHTIYIYPTYLDMGDGDIRNVGTVTSDLIPSLSGSYDLGASNYPWNNIYYKNLIPSVSGGGGFQTIASGSTKLTANATMIDITGLDINTSFAYRLVFQCVQVVAGFDYCYINGDFTDKNYTSRNGEIDGEVTVLVSSSPRLHASSIPSGSFLVLDLTISRDNAGFTHIFGSGNYRNYAGIPVNYRSIGVLTNVMNVSGSVTNITRITLSGSAANAFGSGSTLEIFGYKSS